MAEPGTASTSTTDRDADSRVSDQPAPLPPMTVRRVLGIGDYRLVLIAQVISDFGDALTTLALLLVVNAITGSTASLALMAIAIALPQLVVGVVAGAWVDRLDPRRVMLASDLLRFGIVLGLVFVRTADLLWLLYVLAVAEATVSTFFGPARMTLVSFVVPRNGLMAANSLSQAGRVVAGVLGTGAAGFLVSAFGVAWPAFAIDAGTFALSFLLLLGVRARRPAAKPDPARAGTRPSILADVREGLAIVAGSRQLVATLSSAAAVMLGIGAVNVLFVPLLVNDLRVSPAWFGGLELAQTAGMLLSAGLVATLFAGLAPSVIVRATMAGIAIVTALLGGVTAVWQVVLLLFVVGLCVAPLQAAATTIVQAETVEEARGRVAGLLNAGITAASVLSMAFAGAAGQLIGVRSMFVLCGLVIGAGAVVAVVLYRRPRSSEAAPADVEALSVRAAE